MRKQIISIIVVASILLLNSQKKHIIINIKILQLLRILGELNTHWGGREWQICSAYFMREFAEVCIAHPKQWVPRICRAKRLRSMVANSSFIIYRVNKIQIIHRRPDQAWSARIMRRGQMPEAAADRRAVIHRINSIVITHRKYRNRPQAINIQRNAASSFPAYSPMSNACASAHRNNSGTKVIADFRYGR